MQVEIYRIRAVDMRAMVCHCAGSKRSLSGDVKPGDVITSTITNTCLRTRIHVTAVVSVGQTIVLKAELTFTASKAISDMCS